MGSGEHRENNFDAVRIIAALVVVFGHAHPLAGRADPSLLANSVQTVAVKVFFAASGFLVALSWQSDPHPLRFLLRRALRLMPGLVLLLLVTVLVLGPWMTTHSLGAYLMDPGTLHYFTENVILRPAYGLPGVFATNPYANAVNGSLWSLPVEVLMYLVLPFTLLTLRVDRSGRLYLLLAIVFAVAAQAYLEWSPVEAQIVAWGSASRAVANVAPYFFLGAAHAVTPLKGRTSTSVALLLVAVVALFPPKHNFTNQLALMAVLPYAVLSFANVATPHIHRFGRFGDPSYGVYLYGFPVQQTLYHFYGAEMGPVTNALCASVISLALGYASWHLVEKRALAWKPKKSPAATTPS